MGPQYFCPCPVQGFGQVQTVGTVAPEPKPMPAWVAPVAIVSVIGLIGFMVYSHYKIQQQIIREKGVGAALGYHRTRIAWTAPGSAEECTA